MNDEGNDSKLFSDFTPPSFDEWHKTAVASLKGAPYEKKVITRTYEGIDLQPIYWRSDLEELGHMGAPPGTPPYVRGTDSSGYVDRPWEICQELRCDRPASFNAAARHDCERGQTALGVVLDEPTRRGLDVDQADAETVGAGGLSLCCLDDFRTAFDGIDLAETPLQIAAGPIALPMVAHLAAMVGDGGSQPALRGCVGADPLGELVTAGSLPLELDAAYDMMAATARWAGDKAPGLRTVLVRGCPYHEGGASATQELAAALATGAEYIRAAAERGLDIAQIAGQLKFTFSLGVNFFMEVAKLRAARLLWSQVVAAFGGDAEAQKMSIHGRTSAWTQTVFDPYVNMLRNTTEAFSGVVGGVDSLHVRPFDETLLPKGVDEEFSRRVSRNVQLLLLHESHLTHPTDPAGGSWYVEVLTDQVARKAWEIFQHIESQGGMLAALRGGFLQEAIAGVADQRAANLETRRDVLIGTNKYANATEEPLEVPAIDGEALRKERLASLENYRIGTMSADDHTDTLEALAKSTNRSGPDIVARAIDAVRGGTMGDVFRAAAGSESAGELTVRPIRAGRAGLAYEQLRHNADHWASVNGERVKVFLANIGPIPQHKARADFSTSFFEVGGFEIVTNAGFATADEAAAAAVSSGAAVVVICSTDKVYPDVVPPLARAIKAERPNTAVVLAGKPAADHEAAYTEAGLDHAIYLKCNCYDLLRTLQEKEGVTDER